MDQLILPILALFLLAVFVSAIVLPIVALVISISSRKKLNEKISRLEAASDSVPGSLQQPASQISLGQNLQQLYARRAHGFERRTGPDPSQSRPHHTRNRAATNGIVELAKNLILNCWRSPIAHVSYRADWKILGGW